MLRAMLVLLLPGVILSQIRPAIPGPYEVGYTAFAGRTAAYQMIGGYAVTDGDILIGRAPASGKTPAAGAVPGAGQLWPGGVVPYTVDPGLSNTTRLTNAFAEWSGKTPLRFVPRTNQANYLKFARAAAAFTCNSYVGMQGGEQVVNLGDSCTDFAVIHELGHAIGFWHEQSRNDRDQYIQMHFENVALACVYNYDKYGAQGREASPYDYASAMQYFPYAYSRNSLPVMVTIPAGIPIGSGTALSAIDADTASRLYGRVATATTISTFPEGAQVIVDGQTYTGTSPFNWADGSTHTISVPNAQGDAKQRYAFGRWSDGGAQQHTVTAGPTTRVFTVNFVRQFHTTITALAGGTVTTTPTSSDGFFADGSFVTMTAVPNAGFNFKSWNNLDVDDTGRLTFIYTNNYYGWGPQNSRTFEVNRARDITVGFTSSPVITFQTEPPNMALKVDGNTVLGPFVWTAGEFAANTNHTVTADSPLACRTECITGIRYVAKDWDDQAAVTRTISWDGKSNVTYTLRFRTQHQVTVQSQNTSRGSVAIAQAPADNYYDEGSIISLSATPAAGNRFLNWQNGLTAVDLPGDVTDSLVSSCGNPWLYRVNQPVLLFGYFGAPASPAPRPAITAGGIVNAASGQGGAIAPGAIFTLYGSDLGPASIQSLSGATSGYFENCVAGTGVSFDGAFAPMVYSLQGQVSAIVPYAVNGKSAVDVQVSNQGVLSNAVRMPVQAALPALFTANASGTGQVAAFNQDGSLNSAANPAARGSIVVLFATGEGQTAPAGVDGKLALDTYPKPVLSVKVSIGGADAGVVYAGAAPTLVAGVMQVNVRVPDSVTPGNAVPVVVTVGTFASRSGATLAVQ
jgi:uncharacterized protein (TIGR03437 family)